MTEISATFDKRCNSNIRILLCSLSYVTTLAFSASRGQHDKVYTRRCRAVTFITGY